MIKTAEQLLAERQHLLKEARDILSNPESGAEGVEKAEKMMKDAEALNTRASQLVKLDKEIGAPQPESKQHQSPQGFSGFGDFIGSVVKSKIGGFQDPRIKMFYDINDGETAGGQKALSSGALADGGALIPTEQLTELMALSAGSAIVRPRASVIPMGSKQIEIPVVDQTGTTTDVPPFFGGMLGYWLEDGTDATDSPPKFRKAVLTAHSLVGYTQAPNSLLADAPALGSFLSSKKGFPGLIAHMEDASFLRGSGVGKPLGIINSGAAAVVTRTTTGTIKWDDIANMESAFMGETPVYVATQGMKGTLMKMVDGNGSLIWSRPRDGNPATLNGYPILFTSKLPGVGTKGDILLADFSYYMIGDRQTATVSVEASSEYLFKSVQTAFRLIHRVAGQPWLSAPLTLTEAGSVTVSPFVVVNT